VKLSALVVSYNDAEDLPRCLQSLAFCDERIVVDVGSRDASREVAQAYGALVIPHPHVPFAEKAHADGASQCSNPWILLADPDMEFPAWVGERLPPMIERYDSDGLGLVILPTISYGPEGPIAYGRKAGIRGRPLAFHRDRVHIPGYLHYRGFQTRDGYFTLGLISPPGEGVHHYSMESVGDILRKYRRYLPYEAESRFGIGQRFSWRGMFSEIYGKLLMDVRQRAYRDPKTLFVMLYQVVNIWRAYMALRRYERHIEDAAGVRG